MMPHDDAHGRAAGLAGQVPLRRTDHRSFEGDTGMTTDTLGFTDWVRAHALSLDTLDPRAALDDLEPVRQLIDGARVVAIGEAPHTSCTGCVATRAARQALEESR